MTEKKESHLRHFAKEFVSGGVAGSIGIFIGFPFDLIKVRMQTHPHLYGDAYKCLASTLKEDGFRGLFKGCIPPVVSQAFINALLFTGEATAMKFLEPNRKEGEPGRIGNVLLAGSFGGLCSCVVLVPSEVVKCTMQADDSLAGKKDANMFSSTIKSIKDIYRAEGLRGFYKGFGATAFRDLPSIGLYFYSYQSIRKAISDFQKSDTPTTTATLLAGGAAGGISWALVYPFDVIKTNMQVSQSTIEKKVSDIGGGNVNRIVSKVSSQTTVSRIASTTLATTTKRLFSSDSKLPPINYGEMSTLEVGKALYRRYGIKVFFRGLGTTVLRAFPVNASTFYFYEKFKKDFDYYV